MHHPQVQFRRNIIRLKVDIPLQLAYRLIKVVFFLSPLRSDFVGIRLAVDLEAVQQMDPATQEHNDDDADRREAQCLLFA